MAARFAGWISLLSFAIQQGNLLVTKYTKIKMSSNFLGYFCFLSLLEMFALIISNKG
jgi:hypothetical protein